MTSLADALKLSFGIVTTDRRRPHMPLSMLNSTVFDTLGADGTEDTKSVQGEEMELRIYPEHRSSPAPPIEVDVASLRLGSRNNTHNHPRQLSGRLRGTSGPKVGFLNGSDVAPSPLAHSTPAEASDNDVPATPLHRVSTVPGVSQPLADDDGYEEGGEDEGDEVSISEFSCYG